MKNIVGIIQFPGTNCDRDVKQMLDTKKYESRYLWHEDQFSEKEFSALIIPGGFSFGDYLRCGALAAKSPVMKSVQAFSKYGGPIMGICNGFQVLCEAGLLPGVLVRNIEKNFIDSWVDLKISHPGKFLSSQLQDGQKIRLPIAHGEGRYLVSQEQAQDLFAANQVWLTYLQNPNGSVRDIAGVMNQTKNVFGLMPHPERAVFDWMGGLDGLLFL